MRTRTSLSDRKKPVFWFSPDASVDPVEYQRMVYAAGALHLITSESVLNRVKKLYVREPAVFGTTCRATKRKPSDQVTPCTVFIIDSVSAKALVSSSKESENYWKVFANRTHHLWIKSLAKTISGKVQRIGTIEEDDECLIDFDVDVSDFFVRQNPHGSRIANAVKVQFKKEELLNEYEFFEAKDVAKLLGSTADNQSSYAYNLKKAGKVFSVKKGRSSFYPSFQFNLDKGELRKEVSLVLEQLPGAWSDWDVAFWFFQDNSFLQEKKPFEVVATEIEKVVKAAKFEREILNG